MTSVLANLDTSREYKGKFSQLTIHLFVQFLDHHSSINDSRVRYEFDDNADTWGEPLCASNFLTAKKDNIVDEFDCQWLQMVIHGSFEKKDDHFLRLDQEDIAAPLAIQRLGNLVLAADYFEVPLMLDLLSAQVNTLGLNIFFFNKFTYFFLLTFMCIIKFSDCFFAPQCD
jgi:hypothetical protein